jgi:hypothetical protein
MTFGFEVSGAGRKSMRELGNDAAHQLDERDASLAVLQGGLGGDERSSLEEVYQLVYNRFPSL